MEIHVNNLVALCRICGEKIKDQRRKADALQFQQEISSIWKVSILVDSPNVHPPCICVKCRLICSNKDYVQGTLKTGTLLRSWYAHSEDCTVCCNQKVKKGRPSKAKKRKLAVPVPSSADVNSETDSADENEEQACPGALRVYSICMDSMSECFLRISEEDKNSIFLELCSTIPSTKLLYLLSSIPGFHMLSELNLASSISNLSEDLQSHVVTEILQNQKQQIQMDCNSFSQSYKDLETLQSFNAQEWFLRRNPVLKSVVNGLVANEKNYFQRCLALEHLYSLQGFNFVGPCSFMTNISLLALSNSKLTVNMFGKALLGGPYATLKAWSRDLTSEPKEFPPGECMVAIDNDQIVQRRWKVKVGQKSRVSVVTSVCQAEVDTEGSLQKRSNLAPRYFLNN